MENKVDDDDDYHLAVMVLGHLMTCFGLTHPEVSSLVSPGSDFWPVIVHNPG